MVVSLDKFTAVKMYDKVQRLWKEQIKDLRGADQEVEQRSREEAAAKAGGLHAVGSDGRDRQRGGGRGKEIRQTEARHQAAPRPDEPSWTQHGHDVEYNFKDPEASAATGLCLRDVADRLRRAHSFQRCISISR